MGTLIVIASEVRFVTGQLQTKTLRRGPALVYCALYVSSIILRYKIFVGCYINHAD